MIEATELKNGTTFLQDNTPYKVIKYRHQKIARGGGTVKLKVRNLKNGDLEEKTFNSSHKVEEVETTKKPLQFLYKERDLAVFMDNQSYGQVEIPEDLIEGSEFLTEGEEVDVLFWVVDGEEKPLSVDLPPKATLKVEDTTPGVKGDTASNVYKPATLENGVQIKVPLFIKKGEPVVVDTRTGEYIERARKGTS